MQKVAFEITDNSIQASSSYAGPSVAQCVRYFSIHYIRYTPATTVPKLALCHSSPDCTMAYRQIKKEHLNGVAHCLSEYLERLL